MLKLKKSKQYDDDDGRVIVNMDVSGMRWHNETIQQPAASELVKAGPIKTGSSLIDLTKKELRQITWSAMLAGLTIALVFSAVWVLFTLFATQIWLR